MEARSLTQGQIADLAGVRPQAVSKWLKGGPISATALDRLCDGLELARADLYPEPMQSRKVPPHGVVERSGHYPRPNVLLDRMEVELVSLWRSAPAGVRAGVLMLLKAIGNQR